MLGKYHKMFATAIFFLCTGPLAFGIKVKGKEGQHITLPCTYSVTSSSDITTMCWGRDSCPKSKCNQPIIYTDGYKVTFSSSDKYQLIGEIRNGQVSLTIMNAKLEDQGTYCCRVEHHGWFNDMKLNIELQVDKAPPTRPPTTKPKPTSAKRKTPPPATTAVQPLTTTYGTITKLEPKDLPAETTSVMPDDAWMKTTSEYVFETTGITASSQFSNPSTAETDVENELETLHTEGNTVTHSQSTRPAWVSTVDNLYPPSEEDSGKNDATTLRMDDNKNVNWTSAFPTSESGDMNITERIQEDWNSDLFSGNNVQEKMKTENSLHIVLIAISLSVIIVAAVILLLLKLKGKQRGMYPFQTDPSLELVANAEDPITEKELTACRANNTDASYLMDEAETDKFSSKKPETDRLGSKESVTDRLGSEE
ncbi:T-cell immunoglobulin and mucin domain-containing protein 4-like isoform X1 [Pelobates fuscus]|uniref:T-cell immunoglobulin and mucin domain-containing protein 4-like isoform X1 n=1 Tax=Pelobates fuscus TaxID=191477 RepID=UPI002FE4F7E1